MISSQEALIYLAGDHNKQLATQLDDLKATTRPISDFKIFEENLATIEAQLVEKHEQVMLLEKELRQSEKEKIDLSVLLGDMKKRQAV